MKILVDEMPSRPLDCKFCRFGLASEDMQFCSINEQICSIGSRGFECPYFSQIGVMVRFEPATEIDCLEVNEK